MNRPSGLTALLAIAFAVSATWAWRAQRAARDERLTRLNAEAAADTTIHFLRGQLAVASRLIVQVGTVKPATSVAGRAIATATIAVPGTTIPIHDTVRVIAIPREPLRLAVDTEGLHLRISIKPPPPAWIWEGELTRDTLTLSPTLACEDDGRARLTVTGPVWQPLALSGLEQDAEICNPAPRWDPMTLRPPSLPWLGALAALVVLVVVK